MEPLSRITSATVDVLAVLLDADGPCWGLEIIRQTGRPSGSVYPILNRLERSGWVTSRWDQDSTRRGPRRRLYQLTADAVPAAWQARRANASRGRPTRTQPGRPVAGAVR